MRARALRRRGTAVPGSVPVASGGEQQQRGPVLRLAAPRACAASRAGSRRSSTGSAGSRAENPSPDLAAGARLGLRRARSYGRGGTRAGAARRRGLQRYSPRHVLAHVPVAARRDHREARRSTPRRHRCTHCFCPTARAAPSCRWPSTAARSSARSVCSPAPPAATRRPPTTSRRRSSPISGSAHARGWPTPSTSTPACCSCGAVRRIVLVRVELLQRAVESARAIGMTALLARAEPVLAELASQGRGGSRLPPRRRVLDGRVQRDHEPRPRCARTTTHLDPALRART